jgi:hypothetical protein
MEIRAMRQARRCAPRSRRSCGHRAYA